jgi:hypothetical protein
MSCNKQARARLVEIATKDAALWQRDLSAYEQEFERREARQRAGFPDPAKGHWAAAGITAAMEDAGLLVPSPGTPARRGAIALMDWLHGPLSSSSNATASVVARGHYDKPEDLLSLLPPEPGDIIAWLQNPIPSGMRHTPAAYQEAAGWRRGHVAVIVAVDDESLTTVGWGEGPKPGRVMMRRLWRDSNRPCAMCAGSGRHHVKTSYGDHVAWTECRKTEPRSSTVLWRRPGGLYGIARPMAR